MQLVHKDDKYSYYIGSTNDKQGCSHKLYNITPINDRAPSSGYYNMQYIEQQKGTRFPDRYQPTANGMKSNLYTGKPQ